MSRLFNIPGTIENRITYYHIAAFLISLPFDRFYSQLILTSLLVHTIIHLKRTAIHKLARRENIIFASVLLLTIAGIVYSPDKAQAWKDVQRQLAIGLLPLVLSIHSNLLPAYRNKLLNVFGITCSLTIIYLYAVVFFYMRTNDTAPDSIFSLAYINHNFSAAIDIHATYLSLYVALSLLYFTWRYLNSNHNRYRWLFIVGMLILAAGLLQLAPKSVLIGLALATVCMPFFMPEGQQRRQFIILSLVIGLIALAGIWNIDSFRKRYVGGLKEDLTQASINNEMLEPRIVRWNIAWDLIRAKMITGYGSGTEKLLLKEAYFKEHLFNSYLHELNAHNQYLSIWLKTGLWGLLVFLLTLAYGFWRARVNRDMVLFAFMILISVVGFSENILDVNKGIFFYAFFFSFFAFSGKPIGKLIRLEQQNPT